jgi:hypothetical protein
MRRTEIDAALDGYHYGVQFNDLSVKHPWNGRTERERALADLIALRKEFTTDILSLVRRKSADEPWEIADESMSADPHEDRRRARVTGEQITTAAEMDAEHMVRNSAPDSVRREPAWRVGYIEGRLSDQPTTPTVEQIALGRGVERIAELTAGVLHHHLAGHPSNGSESEHWRAAVRAVLADLGIEVRP